MLRALTEDLVKLEEQMAELKKRRLACEDQRNDKRTEIIKILANHGLSSQKWDDGVSIVRTVKHYPRVSGEHWEAFKAWLMANGYEGLFRVAAQTQASLLRERIELGQEVPTYVQNFEEQGLQVRGKKLLMKGDPK